MRTWIWWVSVVSVWSATALGAGDGVAPTMDIGTNF